MDGPNDDDYSVPNGLPTIKQSGEVELFLYPLSGDTFCPLMILALDLVSAVWKLNCREVFMIHHPFDWILTRNWCWSWGDSSKEGDKGITWSRWFYMIGAPFLVCSRQRLLNIEIVSSNHCPTFTGNIIATTNAIATNHNQLTDVVRCTSLYTQACFHFWFHRSIDQSVVIKRGIAMRNIYYLPFSTVYRYVLIFLVLWFITVSM